MRSTSFFAQLSLAFCCSTLLFFSAEVFADAEINGVWKHSEKPAWIEITFGSGIDAGIGSASVKRHDDNLQAAGLNIINSITPVINQSSQWTGQMYSGAIDNYVVVTLIAVNSKTLVVYDNREANESKEILRLIRE